MGCLSVLPRFSRKGKGIEYKPRRNLLFSFSGGKKRPEKFPPGKKFNIVTQERAAQYTGRLTNYFHLLVSNSTKTSTQSHTFQDLVSAGEAGVFTRNKTKLNWNYFVAWIGNLSAGFDCSFFSRFALFEDGKWRYC